MPISEMGPPRPARSREADAHRARAVGRPVSTSTPPDLFPDRDLGSFPSGRYKKPLGIPAFPTGRVRGHPAPAPRGLLSRRNKSPSRPPRPARGPPAPRGPTRVTRSRSRAGGLAAAENRVAAGLRGSESVVPSRPRCSVWAPGEGRPGLPDPPVDARFREEGTDLPALPLVLLRQTRAAKGCGGTAQTERARDTSLNLSRGSPDARSAGGAGTCPAPNARVMDVKRAPRGGPGTPCLTRAGGAPGRRRGSLRLQRLSMQCLLYSPGVIKGLDFLCLLVDLCVLCTRRHPSGLQEMPLCCSLSPPLPTGPTTELPASSSF